MIPISKYLDSPFPCIHMRTLCLISPCELHGSIPAGDIDIDKILLIIQPYISCFCNSYIYCDKEKATAIYGNVVLFLNYQSCVKLFLNHLLEFVCHNMWCLWPFVNI